MGQFDSGLCAESHLLYGRRFQSVIQPCWKELPADRPDFTIICTNIEQFRQSPTGVDYTSRRRYAGDPTESLYDDAF